MQHLFRDPYLWYTTASVWWAGEVCRCHLAVAVLCSSAPNSLWEVVYKSGSNYSFLCLWNTVIIKWLFDCGLDRCDLWMFLNSAFRRCLDIFFLWVDVCFLFLWRATWMLVWKSVNLLFLPGDVFGWFSVRHEKFCSRGLSVEIWAPFPALELSELHA